MLDNEQVRCPVCGSYDIVDSAYGDGSTHQQCLQCDTLFRNESWNAYMAMCVIFGIPQDMQSFWKRTLAKLVRNWQNKRVRK